MMKLNRLIKVGCLNSPLACFFLLFSSMGYGGQFCLLAAENYYEQLYCEVKAQGQGKRLPSFYDFQKNNEQTQAFLLKRPAAKLGIQVVLPQVKQFVYRDQKPVSEKRVGQTIVDNDTHIGESVITDHFDSKVGQIAIEASPFDRCVFKAKTIECAGVSYNLVGNLSNNKLSKGVLDRKNKMNIPAYQGKPGDRRAVSEYLGEAYEQYISKMLEIGLGGSTFSYNKFVYFYYDVSDKGIDFSQRFETMFGYLKQDKQNLAVSERLPERIHVKKERCDWLRKKTVVCDGGQKNYVYQRY